MLEITPRLLKKCSNQGQLDYETRYDLMVKAFEHTAAYDGMIANHFGGRDTQNQTRDFSNTYNVQYMKTQDMRYGENPHQKAAFYTEANPSNASVSTATQVQGKELSFNNIADTDSALERRLSSLTNRPVSLLSTLTPVE